MADDIYQFTILKNIVACVLAGMSMGGAIGIQFAINFSDKIKSLILMNPGPGIIFHKRMITMKQILGCFMVFTLMLCTLGCSKNKIESVLGDMARDTYENNMRRQRNEKIGKPCYEEPLTYDRYQREKKN